MNAKRRNSIIGGAAAASLVAGAIMIANLVTSNTVEVAPGQSVQAAINSAPAGTEIILQAGADYPGFVLKSGIKVRSSRAGEISGRVAKDSSLLARVRSTVNVEPVVRVPIGTRDWAIE